MDFIHSDLPLFGHNEDDEMWPRSFIDDDSFGCAGRVAFGDWVLSTQVGEQKEWYRIENYGVFHCWAVVSRAYERERLDTTGSRPAFFIPLGTETINDLTQELWVLQIGSRPGSEYILLSRSPGLERTEVFQVLQRKCPKGKVRDSGGLSILSTRYCSIDTREELSRFGRDMLKLNEIGTLSLVPKNVETKPN